jgi:phage terminase small subunit
MPRLCQSFIRVGGGLFIVLTGKQRRFVSEYLIDQNATQAAIRAGYSRRTARSIGSENLAKPDILGPIESKMTELTNRAEIDAEYVLSAIRDTIERCSDLDGKEQVVLRGAELLGRYLGLFSDRIEHIEPKSKTETDLSRLSDEELSTYYNLLLKIEGKKAEGST